MLIPGRLRAWSGCTGLVWILRLDLATLATQSWLGLKQIGYGFVAVAFKLELKLCWSFASCSSRGA